MSCLPVFIEFFSCNDQVPFKLHRKLVVESTEIQHVLFAPYGMIREQQHESHIWWKQAVPFSNQNVVPVNTFIQVLLCTFLTVLSPPPGLLSSIDKL